MIISEWVHRWPEIERKIFQSKTENIVWGVRFKYVCVRLSEHSIHQVVDEVFTVSPITSSLEGVSFLGESSSRASKFEWPEEVVGFFEVWADWMDFIDEVFYRNNAMFSKSTLNKPVVGEGNSLFVDLAVASLVDDFSDGFSWGISKLS